MTRNTSRSMINIGAVDTHIEPYTHTNEYSSEPPVAVCYSCCFTIYYKTRGEIYASSWINNLSIMQVTSLPVLFSLLVSCSGIPVIKSLCVWPDDNGYRNTERAREYLSIVGGANPNLELSSYLTYFSMNP